MRGEQPDGGTSTSIREMRNITQMRIGKMWAKLVAVFFREAVIF